MRQGRTTLAYYGCCAALLGLCALSMADASAADSADNPVVVLDTTAGPITLELDRAKAPITVDNFLKYVDAGFFDGLIFHRVIPGFMIQGGGFSDKLEEKTEGMRPPIQNEARNGLSNIRGTIAMARTSNPNSATSQFFINLVDNRSSPRPQRRVGRLRRFRQGHRGNERRGHDRPGPDGTEELAERTSRRRPPPADRHQERRRKPSA